MAAGICSIFESVPEGAEGVVKIDKGLDCMEILQHIAQRSRRLYKIAAGIDYQRKMNKDAFEILRRVEGSRGKTDPKVMNQAKEYAKEVLGSEGYAPWLYVYSAFTGKFKEGWIPPNYYEHQVNRKLKGAHGKVSNYKSLTSKIFRNNFFPDLGFYVNGIWISTSDQVIPEKEIKEFLFRKSDLVIFKLDKESKGKGIYLFEKKDFEVGKIRTLGNGVFQDYIEQHPFFEELMPSSVATLRITTVLDDLGTASVRSCYLRTGRSEEKYVKSGTNIRIPVDIDTGELYEHGYNGLWEALEMHPDTQVRFLGRRVPHFDNCKSTALELQQQMPFTRCIGWDMTVDKQGEVKVMEWNGDRNDIKFSEAFQGPCFTGLGWEHLWHNKKKPSKLL